MEKISLYEFINNNIGNNAIISGDGDLKMCNHLRYAISMNTPLTIVRWTKKGLVELTDNGNNLYYAPPRSIIIV